MSSTCTTSGMLAVQLFFVISAIIGSSSLAKAKEKVASISSLKDDLKFDDASRLVSQYLLFPENCNYFKNGLEAAPGTIAYAVTGDALAELFAGHSTENCPAVCLERGVHQSLVGAVMPDRYYWPADGTVGKAGAKFHADWFTPNCRQVEICLLQYVSRDEPLDVYWMDDKGNPKKQMILEYGERKTRCITSFIGHSFQVKHGTELLDTFTVEFALVLPFGESPPSDDVSQRNFTKEIVQVLGNEWKRQDRIKRTFSPLGFAKGRLPDDVFASLGALYYNNRNNIAIEEWGGRGVFVNWWETEVAFLQIPWKLKDKHQKRLKDMVSAWAGVEVEETVMYGFRQYQENARLLTHVDRHTTHALSLIVNVAQGGLDEPWPVEVYDHGGRLHEVMMEPGDVVYYESAKNLHGRNRPLKGKNAYYVNLFTHYRPVAEGDDWWYNEDAVPKLPAVMEAEGDCRLADSLKSLGEQLGAVECDDPRLGSNISPAFATAKNVDDLIDWWRYTTPDLERENGGPEVVATPTGIVDEEAEEL